VATGKQPGINLLAVATGSHLSTYLSAEARHTLLIHLITPSNYVVTCVTVWFGETTYLHPACTFTLLKFGFNYPPPPPTPMASLTLDHRDTGLPLPASRYSLVWQDGLLLPQLHHSDTCSFWRDLQPSQLCYSLVWHALASSVTATVQLY
jgi:hypothetical protein